MFNKIMAWTWLVLGILTTLMWLTTPDEEAWFFVLVYFTGMIYLFIKYIETLK